ncbi:response regulator [Candidatus Riflebacteria bacterium]
MKFLVIDDSDNVRRIIKRALQKIDFDDESVSVIEAIDAREAQEKLDICREKNSMPDLILCDWNLPGTDGLKFIKDIKREEVFASIPVIMVTVESGKAKVMQALQAGVSNYLVKPFEEEELRKKVKDTLRFFKLHR